MTDERALDLLIADYLERVDRGEPIDVERLLAGHPELRDDFHAFVRDMRLVDEHRYAPDESPALPATPSQLESDTTPSMLLSETTATTPAEPVDRAQDRAQADHLPREFGRYRLLKELGRGAMGTVYLAEDSELRRRVALKRPRLCGVDQPALRQRFYREAQAAATLHHPNICPVYDLGEFDGEPFITMALIEGRPLSQVIQGGKAFDSRTAASLVRQIALGLAEAHDRGVVHRDLKPGNIMIDPRGEPVVMDFGLAQLAEAATEDRMTQTGMLLGTIGYMSPEQAEGDPTQIGPSTDIYSLGVLLFELLTGRLPFVGSAPQVLRHITSSQPPAPRELQPQVDSRLESICLRMLAKSPSDRYATMHEVVAELEAFLRAPSTLQSPPITTTTPKHSAQRRQTGYPAVLAVGAMLLIGLAAFAVWLFVRTPYGTIQVQLPSDDANVAVDGGVVTLIDKRTGKQFQLTAGANQWKSGEYALQVTHGFHLTLTTPDGQKLSANQFTIHSGKTVLAEVSLTPSSSPTTDPNSARETT
ncbi:MAG: serine/threonine protein kinase, partial [Planctomycetales bacterium]|nr:serine/threonine protein kinase [Planctomycetales bacterium]